MGKDKKLREENKALRLQLNQAQSEINLLRQKLDALARQIFGKRSEQLDPAQLELLLSGLDQTAEEPSQEDEAEEEPTPTRRRPRNGRHAIRTPENLEVVEERIIPDCVQADPDKWKEIGCEENRRLDYQPGRFFWRKIIRPKYVRKDRRDLPPVLAPAPLEISLGGMATPGLLAQILVNRYCDHLPYYRQEQIYWRENGVWISRQQMDEWADQSVAQLERLVGAMRQALRRQPYLQVDETKIRYQDRGRAGPCPKGWLWVALDPGQMVVFHWDESRGHEALEKLIGKDYCGLLGVDGYSAYRAYARPREEVDLIGCWTHARRKFVEAKDEAPRVVGWVLNQIAWLYRWEKSRNGTPLRGNARQWVRASHSRMIVERLEKAFRILLSRYRPKSLMREALEYALNQWEALKRYVNHSNAELSNNFVENAIRPSALGRKNWLFIGHTNAGHRSALIYSITETCRMLNMNATEYLKDVLSRLPSTSDSDLDELTPVNWQAAKAVNASATRQAA